MILKKVFLIILILFGFGCVSEDQGPSGQMDSSDPSPKSSPVQGGSEAVFKVPEDERQARLDFITQQKFRCQQNQGPRYGETFTCDINTSRAKWSEGMLPRAPIFASYKGYRNLVITSVLFPSSFFHNLPLELQNQIKKDAPDQLEIFWIIQTYSYGDFIPVKNFAPNEVILRKRLIEPRQQLKVHYWMVPDREYGGHDSDFNKTYQMMIFDPLDPVENQLSTKNPVSVDVSVHDGNRISPPGVGEVNFGVLETVSKTTLWSYVFDNTAPQGQRRAVTTLHWLVSDLEFQGVEGLMKDSTIEPMNLREIYQAFTHKRSFVAKLQARVYGPSGASKDFVFEDIDVPMMLDLTRLLPSLKRFLGPTD